MEKNKNPWKTLNSKQIYESPWISLQVDEVINPAGKPSTYSITKFKKLAIGVIPIDKDGNTYLVGQWRYPFNKYTWEIPEGGGSFEVEPVESAKRELLEETGITATNWEKILEMDMSNYATNEVAHIFVATNLSFQPPQPDEDEEIEVKKVPIEKVFEMVMKGELTDSLTVAGIMKWKLLQNHK